MSVHSQSAAPYASAAPEFPRHVVTAVLVAHDGDRWLPDALAGLVGQVRPVQSVIAADTGSADDSARQITETLGADRVLHMARRTGFGVAVNEAARTAEVLTPDDLPYLKRPSGWDPVTRTWRDEAYEMPELPYGEPVQWLWLLHDDCAPAPEALVELLRVVDANPSAVIVGPKLLGWYDRRQLLETGVSIASSGRRWTGLDRREQDQGQHDVVRPVLSVSTAGMLIRRDVFDELGGFDRRLPLMRDDVDLCWRAHSAGHTVLVAPEAVVRHAEAAARERRPIDCVGRLVSRGAAPHRVDKAGAVYTLLANTHGARLPWVLLRLLVGTAVRTLAYLVGKVPGQALDEVSGLAGTLLRPGRIIGARRRRGKPRVEPATLRPLFPPPGATVRATVEQVASNFGGRAEPERSSGGRHGAAESGPGGDDADFLEIEQFARLKRVARKPGPVLFLVLLVVSLIACRDLLGGGALAGGALLPAPAEVGELWARYLDGWHPVSTGNTESAPPYLALVAGLSTLLFGSTGLALTLLMVCSVPLAGLTAYFASRPLVDSRLLRAWGSVAYAFLPAATGALAGGRVGTAVLAVLLPLLARAAVAAAGLRLDGAGGAGSVRPSWRAAWATALLLTITTAFTPIIWPVALLLSLALLALRLRQRRWVTATVARCVALLATPMLLLAPWSLSLLSSPSDFLREVGLRHDTGAASALDLLVLTPGGAHAGGGLLLGGLVLAGLAGLLRQERQLAVRSAWAIALTGLLFAALANGTDWAGPATLIYGLALLCAAAVGAEGARERVTAQSFGWQQPVAVLIGLAAVLGPLAAAGSWLLDGAGEPLTRRDPVQVPAFVAEESRTQDQPRTLVLDGDGGGGEVGYMLVRGSGARLGDADLAAAAGENERLSEVVAHLVAGSGADQTRELGGYAVRYVLVREGAPRQLSRVLDTTPGLTRLSQADGSGLWRVEGEEVARVTVVPGGDSRGGAAETVTVAAGPVEAHTKLPDGPEGRVLRLADAADEGWQATLDGRTLPRVTVDGWAQGFTLPASGGRLDLTYETSVGHVGWIWTQGFLLLVTLVLALPGRRQERDDDLPDAEPLPEQAMAGEGRRARRLRAAAESPEGGSPQSGAPETEPETSEPAYPEPETSEPQYPEPQYSEPQYPEPQHPGPQYPEPPYPESQYPDAPYPGDGTAPPPMPAAAPGMPPPPPGQPYVPQQAPRYASDYPSGQDGYGQDGYGQPQPEPGYPAPEQPYDPSQYDYFGNDQYGTGQPPHPEDPHGEGGSDPQQPNRWQ